MAGKILITGGVRSGKSRFALNLALSYPAPRVFLATAEPIDQEMRKRVLNHQTERKDQFITVEEPLNLADRILQIDNSPHPNPLPEGEGRVRVIVVDCLTLWVGNLYHQFADSASAIQDRVHFLVQAVKNIQTDVIVVTNEIGLGIISDHALGRRFVDTLGMLNQNMAQICDEVVVMSCGIPQVIKGSLQNAKVDD